MKKVHLPLRTYLVLLVLGTLVPLLVFATALALVNGRLQRTASDDELRNTISRYTDVICGFSMSG